MRIRSIIVEDEENSRISLYNMLSEFCENVDVVAMAETVDEAVKQINEHQPDLVFLDIELPEKNGFKLLEYFPNMAFDIIFTTAYDQYAIKAFKMSATDYLLKPINIEELRLAVEKVAVKKEAKWKEDKLEILKQHLNNVFQKLALPTKFGFVFVEMDDIIRCEADGNYTHFYLKGKEKILVSRTLKVFDELLSEFNFIRINRADLVNLNYMKSFHRQKKAFIKMIDDTELPLAEGRKEAFFKKMQQF